MSPGAPSWPRASSPWWFFRWRVGQPGAGQEAPQRGRGLAGYYHFPASSTATFPQRRVAAICEADAIHAQSIKTRAGPAFPPGGCAAARQHVVVYAGVLASNSRWRPLVIPPPPEQCTASTNGKAEPGKPSAAPSAPSSHPHVPPRYAESKGRIEAQPGCPLKSKQHSIELADRWSCGIHISIQTS